MTPVEEIKNRLDLVDIVSETVQLRKTGRSYTGLCPFHSNTRTPAFVVFPDSQTWRCFGACAEGGDLFSFVMKLNGWDFKEALEQLARRAGVTLEEPSALKKAKQTAKQHITDLLEAAADYFHQLFLYAPQAEVARRYIEKRGLTAETIATFQLGYALNAWDAARSHFLAQGYSEQDLLDAGLLTENEERGTRYDRFRQRLIIPIRNTKGQTVGFGARTLDPDGIPKYLNSPQTEWFDKSHLLYGLDMAKRHIREARQVVIVEGYMDVIGPWQAGFRNIVAQMGTALTREQLQLLKRYTKRFVIALDADAAGVNATLRGLQVARQALDREVEVRFDASGLVRHEGRLQADIRIITLPPGEDPDSLTRREAAAWPRLLQTAKPVVEYVIGVLTAERDMNDPKAKTEVAQQVIPLIKDVVNPIEREHYWQYLARTLEVDDRSLRQLRVHEQRPMPSKASASPTPTPTHAAQTVNPLRRRVWAAQKREANFLRQFIADATLLQRVDQQLHESGQPPLSARDFTSVDDRAIFTYLLQHPDRSWHALQESLQPRLEALLQMPEENEAQLSLKLAKSVVDWRLEQTKRLNDEIKRLLKESDAHDREFTEACGQHHLQLVQTIVRLDRSKAAMVALERRRREEAAQSF